MVRNVAATQSPRADNEDVFMASSPQQQQQQPLPYQQPAMPADPPLQRLTGPSMQLCGTDAYTKSLMTKIACGQATPEEQQAFNDHVKQARSLPSTQTVVHRPHDVSAMPMQPDNSLGSNVADRMSYGMILEQEDRLNESRPQNTIPSNEHGALHAFPSSTPKTFSDYQMQLVLLEAQNKKRLLMANREATAENAVLSDEISGVTNKSAPVIGETDMERKRQIMIEKEQAEHNFGTNDSTWEFSRSRVLDIHTDNLNKRERVEFKKLWKAYLEELQQPRRKPRSLAANSAASSHEAQRFRQATRDNAANYTKPFCDFLTENPTVFHCVAAMKKHMLDSGWTQLSERETWDLKPWGHYFVERNGSSLIAFVVGANYEPGNGAAIIAGHVDSLSLKLKPVSQVPNKAGYLQLGCAPYAGGGASSTWWDRDLGIAGRVHVKNGNKIITRLVKLDWPIAKIPTLAPHFGAAANGPFNPETQMVPIIGLGDTSNSSCADFAPNDPFSQPPLLGHARTSGPVGSFVQTQPPALVKAISDALDLDTKSDSTIVGWDLELFSVEPATLAGINREFISAGRIDDKLCSWAALQALMESQIYDTRHSSLIKVVGLFDDEEIGSLLRQGARGNFLPVTLERAVGSIAGHHPSSDLMGRTYANSFLVSSDVTHAVNPNFLGAYLENHAPHLNVGVAVAADPNGHMTTDSVSTTIFKRCADKVGARLQVFQIRNDSRSGGTVGPMLSSALGVRAIDADLPQLSMHSIRATCGALDPGLGVLTYIGFLNGFEMVDKEMQD